MYIFKFVFAAVFYLSSFPFFPLHTKHSLQNLVFDNLFRLFFYEEMRKLLEYNLE